ncbi:MAG TPA: hypothetical protein HA360_02285 [Nanoarchaeota archaeon]|nr:hypothetical protein [Candidatus Woesearchaeota archaeon]HIH15014.1 hypothetical protein [Nanoarchaeota archaeon]HIH59370.1 hypothetical protein [Nanoarchaeota archaeon]HII13880.1 hypothetical protein [Nanoarchaeota archaeon]HIJ04638.1 hypothetical protein [Nanoarchaeota archaeon]
MENEDLCFSFGIGAGLGLFYPVISYCVRLRQQKKDLDKSLAELVGKEYEAHISEHARDLCLQERGLSADFPTLYNVDLLQRYLEMHPEKRKEWGFIQRYYEGVHRAALSKEYPSQILEGSVVSLEQRML